MFLRLDGRIGRKGFWLGFAAAVAALVAIDLAARGTALVLLLAPFALYALAAVIVKRLHDRGRSGWWSLLIVTPLVAGFAAAPLARLVGLGERGIQTFVVAVTWLAIAGVVAWIVVDLGLQDGEPGYTEHGPPPLL